MKKVFLTVIATALIAVSASAQMFVGGSLNFGTTSSSSKAGGTSVDGTSSYNFGLSPMIGYYLNDDMAIGAEIGFGVQGTNDNQNPESKTSSTDFSIAPFFRYHMIELGDISVFGQAQVSLGFGSSKNTNNGVSIEGPSTTTFAIGVLPGVSYKLTDNVDLEATIGYLGFSNTSSKPATSGGTEYSNSSFGLSLRSGLNLGFVYKF